MKFEQLPDGSWRYVGRLSARNPHQIFRFLVCTAFAGILWTVVGLGIVKTSWATPSSWLIGAVVLTVFGGLAIFVTYAVWGFGRGIVAGAVFEQVIDKDGVRAWWGPPKPVVMAKASVTAIVPMYRPLSSRVDVFLKTRSWGGLDSAVAVWTDEGLTPEEFDELYDDLVSRGFG